MRSVLVVLLLAAACNGTGSAAVTTTSPSVATSRATTTTTTTTPTVPGCQADVCLRRSGQSPLQLVRQDSSANEPGRPPRASLTLRDGTEVIADFSRFPAGDPVIRADTDQLVEAAGAVDFDGDGTDSLVLAVLVLGATAGPLDLTILSIRDTDVALDLRVGTQRGGVVHIGRDDVVLEAGSYAPGDAGCCPSSLSRQRFAWDPKTKRVDRVEQTLTPLTTTAVPRT